MRLCVQNAPYLHRTDALFAKHRVDWKENHHILLVEDTPPSNLCKLGGGGGAGFWRSVTRRRARAGWGKARFVREIASEIACINRALSLSPTGDVALRVCTDPIPGRALSLSPTGDVALRVCTDPIPGRALSLSPTGDVALRVCTDPIPGRALSLSPTGDVALRVCTDPIPGRALSLSPTGDVALRVCTDPIPGRAQITASAEGVAPRGGLWAGFVCGQQNVAWLLGESRRCGRQIVQKRIWEGARRLSNTHDSLRLVRVVRLVS